MDILRVEHLSKSYGKGNTEVRALTTSLFRQKRRVCRDHRPLRLREVHPAPSVGRRGSSHRGKGLYRRHGHLSAECHAAGHFSPPSDRLDLSVLQSDSRVECRRKHYAALLLDGRKVDRKHLDSLLSTLRLETGWGISPTSCPADNSSAFPSAALSSTILPWSWPMSPPGTWTAKTARKSSRCSNSTTNSTIRLFWSSRTMSVSPPGRPDHQYRRRPNGP